jgi:myosin heavy subunit
VIAVIYIVERWKMTAALVLSLFLLMGLVCVGSLRAQIKKDEVDFEVMATITFKKGDNLWDLAQKYYGNPLKWPLIKDMNKIPNEGAIPVGTVVYVPVEDAKKIVKEVEAEIKEETETVKKLSAEVEELKKELQLAKEKSAECAAKSEQLSETVKEREATVKELEGMMDGVKAAMDKVKAETELELQAEQMRAQAQAAAAEKAKMDLSDGLDAKEKEIKALEAKLQECQRSIEVLNELRADLNAKIKQAGVAAKRPPEPEEVTVDAKAKVAAIAIALVGSLIWIGSN